MTETQEEKTVSSGLVLTVLWLVTLATAIILWKALSDRPTQEEPPWPEPPPATEPAQTE